MAFAPNSVLMHDSQIRKYLEFVALFFPNYAPIPCDALQVALYATWLARTLKYSLITYYLSGLAYFLRQNGVPGIDYSDFVLSSTLKGIKRKLGNAPRQSIPLLPSMLRNFSEVIIDMAPQQKTQNKSLHRY